jgi:glycosyltransferase involved in cell wall biosynthesis
LSSRFEEWWTQSAVELACQAGHGARLIFATMSPFESAEVAARVSQQLGIPWVADLRDPWALDEMQVYPTFLHRKFEMWRMQRLLSSAAVIVMNTPDATAALRSAFPKLTQQIITIPNGFDAQDFADEPAPRTDSKFRIVHAGYLQTALGQRVREMGIYHLLRGAARGVDILTRSHVVLMEALRRWCEQQPEVRQDLEVVFAGVATPESLAVVKNAGLSAAVRFAGYLPHGEALQLVRTANLLFLPMHNLPPGRRCRIVPGKTYEYIASRRPILAAVPDGDARDFLTQCGTGLVCRPDDVAAMIRHLQEVYGKWKCGESVGTPRCDFADQFERRRLTALLADAFRSLLALQSERPNVSTRVMPQDVAHLCNKLNPRLVSRATQNE